MIKGYRNHVLHFTVIHDILRWRRLALTLQFSKFRFTCGILEKSRELLVASIAGFAFV